MKNECSIVQDILPLYVEDMVSEDTAGFVKEHLRGCPECRAELEKLREPVTVQLEPDINAAPLKRLKKTLLMKKMQTILCTVAVLLALLLSGISLLIAPEYFEYTSDLVTASTIWNLSGFQPFATSAACASRTLGKMRRLCREKEMYPT